MTTGSRPGSALRRTIDEARADLGCTLKALTVMYNDTDPFRLDTPGNHVFALWFQEVLDEHLPSRQIHLRGVHYVLASVEVVKPGGAIYRNTWEDWKWLNRFPAKMGRWLTDPDTGEPYVSFSQIVDERNADPIYIEWSPPSQGFSHIGGAAVSGLVDLTLGGIELRRPYAAADFEAEQPYKLIAVGEKSSLQPVLEPLCQELMADLFLPTGQLTDTLIYDMLTTSRFSENGETDERPVVFLYFGDCDPSGYDMPRTLARKLQAHQALEFPDLEFEVVQVALTPDQVRENDLPSTPLKDTEQRADVWVEAFGVEQTEIDALATLQPDLLEQIAEEAVAPYFDHTLEHRRLKAAREWHEEARRRIDALVDQDRFAELEQRVADLRDAFEQGLEEIRDDATDLIDVEQLELPDVEVPEPELPERETDPLIDSRWSWADQTLRLMAHKRYEDL